HCKTHNISYVAASTAAGSVETPNTKSWVLLGPRGRSGARTWVEDPKCLTRFTFTLQALRNVPFSYTPNYLGEGPTASQKTSTDLSTACSISPPVSRIMFWFTPAWLVGFFTRFWLPLMATLILSVAHRARRVLPRLFGAPSPDVYVLSDSDDDVHVHTQFRVVINADTQCFQFPEAEALIDQLVRDGLPPLIRTDPGAESRIVSAPLPRRIVTRSVRRQQWQDEAAATAMPVSRTVLFIPGPLLTSAMDLTRTSNKPRSFLGPGGPTDLTLQHMPGSGPYSLAAWQDHILIPRELDERVSISARSVDEGARTLITLCLWLFAGRPTGLKFKEILQEQFPWPRPAVDGATRGEQAVFGLQVTM
ncbi:hypothetical protein B0H10DRAFT_1953955, partial [Mycena sp. CBHHK59/15]